MLMCPPPVADCTFPGTGCSNAPTFPRDFPAAMADGRGGGDGRVCLSSFLSWCVETKRGGIPSGSSGCIATFSSSSADGPYSTGKAVLMTSGSCQREQREFLKVCSHWMTHLAAVMLWAQHILPPRAHIPQRGDADKVQLGVRCNGISLKSNSLKKCYP